ncbi:MULTISPECIES: pyridoxine/pyridoxamine 5'-phosphate oxidase [Methylobacterium]|uniref:Pyridoxine/pyridoxamine 5'-phosphate oxidase n=1 Tax=Methylobacterium hispanicum TaxID=270350 RepID=A0AAV4ZEP5_9HYPH|nr:MULTISPECIES: pyridoxal 5'-phosphate synthase [Methylobacterium]GJD86611.1 Pyridoxine/pyridoxamine 5'-phosphate oxidase [Methylobacterium hispanicum]
MSLKEQLRGLKSLAGPYRDFDTGAAPDEPASLFGVWLQDAITHGIPEAHAMTLSTVDAEGCPDARVLILKNVDADGWHFASTKLSPKGRQIALCPQAALIFYWQPLGRQVRLRGQVSELSREICEADFLARPIGSRASALLARQSDVLEGDEALDIALAEQRHLIEGDPFIVSTGWTVYAVQPTEVEFWQADGDRRHTRLRYRRAMDSQAWQRERLWP